MCKHSTCATIRQISPNASGIGLVLYLQHTKHGICFGLGREKGGKYAGSYNLCAGSMDLNDKGCYLETLIRELNEEFGIKVSWSNFDEHFRDSNKKVRFFVHHGTPIFIGKFNGTKRETIRFTMARRNSSNRSSSFKEMDDYDLFKVILDENICQVDLDFSKTASRFASVCVAKAYDLISNGTFAV